MDQMKVAHSSGCLFDIRFQVINGVVELGMPVPGHLAKAGDQLLTLRPEEFRKAESQLPVEGFIPYEESLVK